MIEMDPRKEPYLNAAPISDILLENPLESRYTGIQEVMNMEEKIKTILEEKVNPLLAEHYGAAVLVGFENGIAKVRLTGACSTCPSAQYTIEDIVKNAVLESLPEVKDVVLDTSVSEDLLDMARKILNKEV